MFVWNANFARRAKCVGPYGRALYKRQKQAGGSQRHMYLQTSVSYRRLSNSTINLGQNRCGRSLESHDAKNRFSSATTDSSWRTRVYLRMTPYRKTRSRDTAAGSESGASRCVPWLRAAIVDKRMRFYRRAKTLRAAVQGPRSLQRRQGEGGGCASFCRGLILQSES